MRAAFGIVSLLLVLAVVGLLARKQLSATRAAVPAVPALQQSAPLAGAGGPTPPAPVSVREQSQQVQQHYRQAMEGLVRQPRPMPQDAP